MEDLAGHEKARTVSRPGFDFTISEVARADYQRTPVSQVFTSSSAFSRL